MNFWQFIFSNRILNATVLAWFIAQLIKVILILIDTKKIDFSRFWGSGGMPSSHSSTMVALVTIIARTYGFSSPFFAISFTMMMVVIIDAMGVRRDAGKQATVLNKMIENIDPDNPDFWDVKLRELIGHTPLQVFVGAVLGFAIAMGMPILSHISNILR